MKLTIYFNYKEAYIKQEFEKGNFLLKKSNQTFDLEALTEHQRKAITRLSEMWNNKFETSGNGVDFTFTSDKVDELSALDCIVKIYDKILKSEADKKQEKIDKKNHVINMIAEFEAMPDVCFMKHTDRNGYLGTYKGNSLSVYFKATESDYIERLNALSERGKAIYKIIDDEKAAKRAAIDEKILAFIEEHGSDLLKARVENKFEYLELFHVEYKKYQLGKLKYSIVEDTDDFSHLTIKNPSLVQIEFFNQLKSEGIDVQGIVNLYDSDEDEDTAAHEGFNTVKCKFTYIDGDVDYFYILILE